MNLKHRAKDWAAPVGVLIGVLMLVFNAGGASMLRGCLFFLGLFGGLACAAWTVYRFCLLHKTVDRLIAYATKRDERIERQLRELAQFRIDLTRLFQNAEVVRHDCTVKSLRLKNPVVLSPGSPERGLLFFLDSLGSKKERSKDDE